MDILLRQEKSLLDFCDMDIIFKVTVWHIECCKKMRHYMPAYDCVGGL